MIHVSCNHRLRRITELQEEVAECARAGEQDLRDLQLQTDGSSDPDVQRLQRQADSIRSKLDSRLTDRSVVIWIWHLPAVIYDTIHLARVSRHYSLAHRRVRADL